MTPDEIKPFLKYAAELFSKTPPAKVALIADILADGDYRPEVVTVEIKNHALRNEFLEPSVLRESIRRAHEKRASRIRGYEQETVAQWLRRTLAQSCAGRSDTDVLIEHYAKGWNAVEEKPLDTKTVDEVRGMIRGHARRAFIEIGMDKAKAEDFARTCVGMESVTAGSN